MFFKKIIIPLILFIFMVAAGIFVITTPTSLHKNNAQVQFTDKNYIAMGDSVAAGVGIGPEINKCGTTNKAFSDGVAQSLGLSLQNIACSGATIQHGITGIQPGDTDTQINKLFKAPVPGIISITIGANDVGWLQTAELCRIQTCGTDTDKKQFMSDLTNLRIRLRSIFEQVKVHYGEKTLQIYLTGYYQLVSASSDTSDLTKLGISDNNIKWMEYMHDQLNATLKEAANGYIYVHYVPVDFTGHEFYSPDPWVQGLSAPSPLHPNEKGQEQIANALITAIKSAK